MPARIIIGGDIVPTKSNYSLFEGGDAEVLVGQDLFKQLNNADFTIFNMEAPLTDKEMPVQKCGPNLIAPEKTIEGIKKMNPHFFTLANNHILDQGEQGLVSTMNILNDSGIAYAGAGNNLNDAVKPYIREIDGFKIGIYCCAEHEFSIATESEAGANPFDPLWSLDHVGKLKKKTDYVIVLYHGGKEHYRYPSPNLQKICRRLIDKGANLVVCQHSHCVGCEEKYKSGTIVYGQGNFIFDDSDSEFWQTGLLIGINDDFEISYIPIVKTGNAVRLADEGQGREILDGFCKRSKEIKTPNFVEEEYSRFAEILCDSYLSVLSGRKSLFFRILNRLTGGQMLRETLKKKYSAADMVQIINYVNCEAHRELLLQGIGKWKDTVTW